MKKLLLLFILVTTHVAYAAGDYVEANNWRWKKSENSTATSTDWLAPMGVSPVVSTPGNAWLRMSFYVSSSGGAGQSATLEYATEPPSTGTSVTWRAVPVGNPDTASYTPIMMSTRVVAGEPTNGYSVSSNASLAQLQKSTHTSATSGETTGTNIYAPNDDSHNQSNYGSIGVSTTSAVNTTSSNVSSGYSEIEYRIAITKAAKPGQQYFFRVKSTYNNGLVYTYDYDGGYPNIVISKDFAGAVNAELPDLSVGLTIASGLTFTTTPKSAIISIANTNSAVSSIGTIKATISLPNNAWSLGGSAPSGWSLSGNSPTYTLTSSSAVISTIPLIINTLTVIPPASGNSGGAVQVAVGDASGSAGGDGRGYNNKAAVAVYKP